MNLFGLSFLLFSPFSPTLNLNVGEEKGKLQNLNISRS